MRRRGRPTEAELQRIRELIARFLLMGYTESRIVEALGSLRDSKGEPAPIALSVRSVRNHIAAIKAGWLARRDDLDEVRAELIGRYQQVVTEAAQGAVAKRGTTLEIAHLRLQLEASDRLARLLGLEVRKVELSGSVGTGPSEEAPVPSPEALRQWADELEAE